MERHLPDGRTMVMTTTYTAELADRSDPQSVVRLGETRDVDWDVSTRTYTRSDSTVVETTAEGRRTVTVLDAAGRTASEKVADHPATSYQYDAEGRVVHVGDSDTGIRRGSRFTYNSSKYQDTATDALGRTTRTSYDDTGLPTTVTSSSGRTTGFRYDNGGSLVGITPDNRLFTNEGVVGA